MRIKIISPPNPNPPASYVPANTTQQQQQLHQNNRYVTFVTTPPPTSASSVSASTTTAASTNNNGINQQGVLPQLSSVSSQIQPITTSGPPPLRIISHPPEIKRSKNRAQTRTTLVSLTRSWRYYEMWNEPPISVSLSHFPLPSLDSLSFRHFIIKSTVSMGDWFGCCLWNHATFPQKDVFITFSSTSSVLILLFIKFRNMNRIFGN